MAAIFCGYVDGLPRHVSAKGTSYFMVASKAEFLAMSSSIAQGHLRGRHIVVPDMKLPAITFNCQGFRELDSLDAVVDIEGM
jgi:hypothetical protein